MGTFLRLRRVPGAAPARPAGSGAGAHGSGRRSGGRRRQGAGRGCGRRGVSTSA